jgi:hypothetical protein
MKMKTKKKKTFGGKSRGEKAGREKTARSAGDAVRRW